MRRASSLLPVVAVAAWIAALVAGASFAVDLAYVCGLLGVGMFLHRWSKGRRRRRA